MSYGGNKVFISEYIITDSFKERKSFVKISLGNSIAKEKAVIWFLCFLSFPSPSNLWVIRVYSSAAYSDTHKREGTTSQCRPRHFCYVDQGDSPFVTLVICGKYCLYHPDYLFIFTVLRFCGGPSAGVGLINALWRQTVLSPARWGRAVGCNEPFRSPLYEQLRDCRSQYLYWVSYL